MEAEYWVAATATTGELHDLPGGVGDRQIGDGALVEGAPIGLAAEVADVGVPAVRARPGHDVGAGSHRLGLELLESPGLALGTAAPERSPSGR